MDQAATEAPRRTEAELETIQRAKQLLMHELKLWEPVAFRMLRNSSMQSRRPLAVLAETVLANRGRLRRFVQNQLLVFHRFE